ncbi:MAG: BREX-1 system phosphatase PglZ type B [Desulfovibrio sp.]|nr:BREX-1 system phosphatase PglZ type B [Desulfovibrio sp.]
MRVLVHLLKTVRAAATFNPEVQVAPVCILWPDRERQWESVLPVLQASLPELMVLGDYAPEQRTGPAIWLRCALAGHIDATLLPEGKTPILYLPGVSRQDLRAVESCPDHLKPLAELQYRGVIWSQINAKDWTILAYLKSDQGGLGLDVAQDNDAKQAMQLVLSRLLEEDVKLLKGKRLDKDYFNTLLTGGDPVRDVLQWLDQGDVFRAKRSDHEWKAFNEVCKSGLAFIPQNEGILAGCVKLANHQGPWLAVWERFCEAPQRYPGIPQNIRKCSPPSDTIFWHSGTDTFDGWPQWNDEQEKALRHECLAFAHLPAHEARAKIGELEKRHGRRRTLVWAELGEAPLAKALEHLADVADKMSISLAAGTVHDLITGYMQVGWRVDDGVLRALAQVRNAADMEAVTAVVRSIYLPWAEASARHLQKVVDGSSYPGGTHKTAKAPKPKAGDCIVFVDGLRFDAAKRLAKVLLKHGLHVAEEPLWAALPSVTATGKAAVSPVGASICGANDNSDFEPSVAGTGQSLKGGHHLKKLLCDAGWAVLEHSMSGNGQGKAWCEYGDIDHEGHNRGSKLARHLDDLIGEIKNRVVELFAAGWTQVHVVTDHGWLLMPGGLPKIDLPGFLTENKWGRCASLKPGAACEERLYPWYWNPEQQFALADGVSCFKKGEEYTHGGLSLQECLTLQLVVTSPSSVPTAAIRITDVVWKGMRCTVVVDGNVSTVLFDIRLQAGNEASSIVLGIKPLRDDGTASVVVEDEDMAGRQAFIVLLDENGALAAQSATVIGGGAV